MPHHMMAAQQMMNNNSGNDKQHENDSQSSGNNNASIEQQIRNNNNEKMIDFNSNESQENATQNRSGENSPENAFEDYETYANSSNGQYLGANGDNMIMNDDDLILQRTPGIVPRKFNKNAKVRETGNSVDGANVIQGSGHQNDNLNLNMAMPWDYILNPVFKGIPYIRMPRFKFQHSLHLQFEQKHWKIVSRNETSQL